MAGYIGSKGSGIISGIGASIAELNLNDKASANGTTEANKVLTADGNKDVTAIRNLTATGDATVGGAVAATGDATVGGAITATGTVTRSLTRGSIDVGNSSGVSAPLAAGGADTVLTSDGTDISWAAAGGAVPAGSVIYHAANTAPTGFIKANGAAVSRSTYSDLFSAISTTFGVGDGSSTFNVPDLRGEFARGWDDSRGIDSGRAFGSSQSDEFEAHYHLMQSSGGSQINGGVTTYPFGMAYNSYYGTGAYDSKRSQTVGGAAETRPRNVALLACIKF